MPTAKQQRLLRTIVEAIAAAADLDMKPTLLALDLALTAAEREAPVPSRAQRRGDRL